MADDSPPSKRMRYDLTKTFDVVVGRKPNQQRFTVYHDLLVQHSEFFRAARSQRWTDPKKPTTLKYDDPAVFSTYLHIITFGAGTLDEIIETLKEPEELPAPNSIAESSSNDERNTDRTNADENDQSTVGGDSSTPYDGNHPDDKTGGDDVDHDHNQDEAGDDDDEHQIYDSELKSEGDERRAQHLVDLYLLSDRLLDPVRANLVIDKLMEIVVEEDIYPSESMVKLVYNSTSKESPLRRLIRDWFVYDVDMSWSSVLETEAYPFDFLKDLTAEFMTVCRSYRT